MWRRYGYGYPHQVLVHVPDAHNYDDYSDGSMLPPEFAEAEEELYQEVLADPAAFADPAITEEMMYRFLEAFRRATGSDSVRDMSYTSAGFDQRFDEECLEIVKNDIIWKRPGSMRARCTTFPASSGIPRRRRSSGT